jgi:formylglycine-generating enzyme required for sulfatase activity
MGSSDTDTLANDEEKPQHRLELPDFWIGKTPVTNAQFRLFVEGDGYSNQAYWTPAGWQWRKEGEIVNPWDDDEFQWREEIVKPAFWDDEMWNGAEQPVVGISWLEAVAYCRWLSAQTSREFRLPTEAEWEKAMRGPKGLIWPWGNTWMAGRCNSEEAGINRTTPVGQYPTGASPYGALDMAGNVCEWCATKWRKIYPYHLEDEWQPGYLQANVIRIISDPGLVLPYNLDPPELLSTYDAPLILILRGGAWSYGQKYVRGAYRDIGDASARGPIIGMRVASHSPEK